jgi:hypothetical protein
MSINEYSRTERVVRKSSTTDTSDAAISEVHPVIDDRTLRNLVFAGIRTNQLEIQDGAVKLLNEASAVFISRLAAAVEEPIVLTPGITPRELDQSKIYIIKSHSSLAEYLEALKAASSAIDEKYTHVGGFLGDPVTGVQFGGKNYEIPYRKYERGAIYVTPHGTHEVHGAIYQKYVALGAEAGFLGFPETDEQDTLFGTGRFNNFQGGSIYFDWNSQAGAWSIHGPIRDKWRQMNAEQGYLGFPVSDIEQRSFGSVSYFQRGSLVLRSSGRVEEDYPDSVTFTTKLEGGDVKCSTDFGMNSRGEWFFRGHLHNDGFAGNTTTVVTSPRFVDSAGRAFVAPPAERSLGGTLSIEERNDDWDQTGSDDFIRDNWDIIRHAGIRTVMKTDTQIGDVLEIAIPILAIALVFGSAATKKWCGPVGSQSRDPITGDTTAHVGWQAVEPGEECPPGYPN